MWADDATLARGQALHDFDVLALELEKLAAISASSAALPGFGAAADWRLNLPGELRFSNGRKKGGCLWW